MIRKINVSLFILLCGIAFGQQDDCRYADVKLGSKKHIAELRTEPVMVENYQTQDKGRVVDFSLFNTRGLVILNVEIYKDSKSKLMPSCVGKGSELTLSLSNGSKISLPQIGARLCGYDIPSAEKGYNNIKNMASFLITEDKFDDLKNNEILFTKLSSEEFNFEFIMKSQLHNDENNEMLHPSRYFIDQLDCVVNPKIIVQD